MRRIILTPPFRPRVEAEMPAECRRSLTARWMDEEAWVRHDEHVHVDFDVD